MRLGRSAVGLAALAALAGAAAGAFAADAKPSPYNVVIVDICSARADHFGFYGYSKRATTPGLDALAKESTVFDAALAQSSWCLPNYASLFTGMTPEEHGFYSNEPGKTLPPQEPTIAERLQAAGYHTAAFSGGVYLMPGWQLQRGFDLYENNISTREALPGTLSGNLPKVRKWLKANRKGPFFLYLSVDDLHAPYQSDDPFRFDAGYNGIASDTDTLSVRFYRAYNGEPLPPLDLLKGKLDVFRADPSALYHLTARYDASLRTVDDEVSSFIKELKGMRLWNNSVVVVTADHGELLGEHGLLGHTQGLYEPVLHVPLLVHHPGYPQAAGRRVAEPVERIDLTPTLLESAGVDVAGSELQGRSLLPLLGGRPAAPREYVYASSKRNLADPGGPEIDERVVRKGRWKLHWYLYKDAYELYDLQTDPGETRDVSRQNPEIVNELGFAMLKRLELSRPHAPGLPSGRGQAPPSELVPERDER